jgi:hypothetical protein
MTVHLHALCFAATDPVRLADFWSRLLDRPSRPAPDGSVSLAPTDGAVFGLRFVPGSPSASSRGRIHLDLTSATPADQRATVERALLLGARHLDVGQLPSEGHVVLADPEGNALCVIEAGNRFLDGCGTIGAINCDGTQAVGHFWSAALGWPLVWDQDEETAIQSPSGGTKIAWGGPPVAPRVGPDRVRLELLADRRPAAEVERLVGLGAEVLDEGRAGRTVLADPDGNEFTLR